MGEGYQSYNKVYIHSNVYTDSMSGSTVTVAASSSVVDAISDISGWTATVAAVVHAGSEV